MRLATWNVNNVVKRLPLLLAWLDATKPDVVALQELKCTDAAFPTAALAAAGYGTLCVGERTWNGVAILARDRQPIELRRRLPGDDGDRQARYLEAAVGGIVVASLYAPNGNPQPGPKFEFKLAWLERLIAHAASLRRAGVPVVLAGDYNVVPTDADIYSPRTWLDNALLQTPARQAFARLTQQGWIDSLRTLHPDAALYTFWDYRRNHWARNAGLRIDHLLLCPSLRPRLLRAGVDRECRAVDEPSDHAPVWVELGE